MYENCVIPYFKTTIENMGANTWQVTNKIRELVEGKQKNYNLDKDIPSIYDTISTPLYTSYSKCVATKTDNTFSQCNIPYSCITVFARCYKPTTWRLEVYRFPGYTCNPFFMTL